MESTERPEWVPDDVPDKHLQDYAESAAGTIARLAWAERHLTGVSPRADQTQAHLQAARNEQLRRIDAID